MKSEKNQPMQPVVKALSFHKGLQGI